MKFRNIVLALAVCLGLTFTAHAQTFTYAIGTGNCSPGGGISCSAPLSLAGADPASFWLAEDLGKWPYRNSIEFGEGLSDLGTATINQDASFQPTYGTVTATKNGVTKTQRVVTSLSLTYHGAAAAGNTYNGAMTVSFDYYYVWVCAPRSPGCGFHRKETGGSTTYYTVNGYAVPMSPTAPTPTCLPVPGHPCPEPPEQQDSN